MKLATCSLANHKRNHAKLRSIPLDDEIYVCFVSSSKAPASKEEKEKRKQQ
jgi:hypothetical protein